MLMSKFRQALVEKLSSEDSEKLIEDLRRSDSPVAQAVRVRTPELKPGSRIDPDSSDIQHPGQGPRPEQDKRTSSHEHCCVVYLYLECVLRKISDSMHDPNWQVQRKALATMCNAVDLGYHHLVFQVPLLFGLLDLLPCVLVKLSYLALLGQDPTMLSQK